MPKIFDYKFLIILGLSLVVYFLYTEVETLNKRVSKIELNSTQLEVKTPKKQIELPPPPTESDEDIDEEFEESIEESIDETVEEYSNEETPVQVYSHDKLDSNDHEHEHDTQLVESVINMVKDNSEHEEVKIMKEKQSVDQLLKLKLDELQAKASELEININNENGKKKRKVDLANEIFNKLQ
jgi:hypothetical protein